MNNILSDETIIVKCIEENTASWILEGKDGHLRWEGTAVSYDVPLTSNGVKQILKKEEQAFLEKEIDDTRPKGWLSPYVKKENAWTGKNRYKVVIPVDGIELDMNNAIDFIKHKILLANVEDIAPSYAERLDRKYIFYMERKSNIEKTRSDRVDKQLEAMEFITKIKDDLVKMRNVLLVLFRGKVGKIPLDITIERCRNMLYEYNEVTQDMFLQTIRDEELKYKILYYKALEKGAFEMINFQLRAAYKGGKLIGETIEDGIKYIKEMAANQTEQEEYAIFKERIKR